MTVQFTCADADSGIPACPPNQTLGAEGAAVASSAQTVTDVAGNTSAASNVVTVKIDKTLPTVSLVGPHTVTATVKDMAGNQNSTLVTYTVLAWTLNGFYQPVDMGGMWNTVKNGSTVPFQFKVFAGSTELTDPSIVNQPLKATQAACTGGLTDDIELVASGGTSLL